MSGHSKWSNIKDRKAAVDKKRSSAFTKCAKDILVAVRQGGGDVRVEVNVALRTAVDKARAMNMPKDNISRLLERFEARKDSLVSLTMEGYARGGVPIFLEVETDNKNRTLAEVKTIFKKNGGNLGENGSVAFLFDRVGEIEVDKLSEEVELKLIDQGAIDFGDQVIVCKVEDIKTVEGKAMALGLEVERAEMVMRPKIPQKLTETERLKVESLVSSLEENEDVIRVFSGGV